MILVLMGPSGAGKTTFENMCEQAGFARCISHTTRKRRAGEAPDSYVYVTKEEFTRMLRDNEFAEHVEYHGNFYGVVKSALVQAKNTVVVVEPDGFRQIKKLFGSEVYSVYFVVPEHIRRQRCIARGDSVELVESRIMNDRLVFTLDMMCIADKVVRNLDYSVLGNSLSEILQWNQLLLGNNGGFVSEHETQAQ